MRRKAVAAAAALGLALITGCSEAGETPKAAAEASKTPDGIYDSARELKEGFVDAGGQCGDWDQHNKSVLAEESGSCGGSAALSWFGDNPDQDAMEQVLSTFELLEIQAIIGENWIIQTTQFDDVALLRTAQKMHADVLS